MKELIQKYEQKLYQAGLVSTGNAVIGALDDECVWNQFHDKRPDLEKILTSLPINALIFAKPAMPFGPIIDNLSASANETICPQDTESRTFLHEIPIIRQWDRNKIIQGLSHRKAVIVPQMGVIATGALTPEQAFVVYSSLCFACFVAFFSEKCQRAYEKQLTQAERDSIYSLMAYYKDLPTRMPHLKQGPFQKPDTVYNAITEVGYHTVSYGLVDSYFGNVSYELDGILYISQTASSLDELAGQIDPCPLDGSSCAAITASSEFSAHKKIVLDNNYQAVLHGHPRFSVVMSLFCTHRNLCHNNNQCHTHCNKNRQIQDVPVIPGEVGCGPYGLVHTLPKAFKDSKSVIVYGHGVFTVGEIDFISAFERLARTEKMCQDEYFRLLKN